jgi:peptide/nickel transport system substrate-binding protein
LQINLLYAIQWGDPALHELAKEYWEAVGVRVELREMSTEAYRAMAANNDHDIQVTTSGTVTEAPLYSNPFRLFPPFGDAALEPLFGAPWVEWHNSNGEQGIEPPDDIKELWDLTDQWKSSLPGSDDYISLGKKLVHVQMDRGMIIGTITSPPVVTIVSRRLGNVPQDGQHAQYYRTYPYRTDQWYFKDAIRNPRTLLMLYKQVLALICASTLYNRISNHPVERKPEPWQCPLKLEFL